MSAMAGVSSSGVMFGGDVPLATAESRLGRKLAIVRVYGRLGRPFGGPRINRIMAAGTTVLASLDTFPGGATYTDIAAGREDAAIKSWLNQVERSAVRYHLPAVYVTFQHEADVIFNHRGLGTPAQFVGAWDHIHQLAAAAHLNWTDGGRMHWVFILTHFAYISGRVSRFWPGTHEVDIVGADGYNTGGCRVARATHAQFTTGKTPPETPASLFGKLVEFAASHGSLPVFIAEWGSQVYAGSSEQAVFITQMRAFVSANQEIAGAMYWNSHSAQNLGCSSSVNNQPASLAALAAMGHSPGLQGHLVP